MASMFSADTSLNAWSSAATYLSGIHSADQSNIILEVDCPTVWNPSWFEHVDPRLVAERGERPSDVANTIFPLKTWQNSLGREDFYKRYKDAHVRGHRKRWGTYFLRLIDFGASRVNQLENGIAVLNRWKNEPGTAIVFHLSSPEFDHPRPLGGPCLQLIQLQAYDRTIDMVAVYRNHDYFNKAFPNLVGLGRLLSFICDSSGRRAGRLTCYSAHAFSSAGKSNLSRLLERL